MPGPFVVVTEVGPGNMQVERFESSEDARAKVQRYWCCWILFKIQSSGLPEEIVKGGHGWAYPAIRRYAAKTFQSTARDNDARERAAAAAEARAAGAASKQQKPQAKTAVASDGKTDLAQAAAWN